MQLDWLQAWLAPRYEIGKPPQALGLCVAADAGACVPTRPATRLCRRCCWSAHDLQGVSHPSRTPH